MTQNELTRELSDAIWSVIKKHDAGHQPFEWSVSFVTKSGKTKEASE